MPNYPNAARLLIGWMKTTLGVVNACGKLPTNYVQTLKDGPVHVVARFGGADRLPGLDVANVAVDTYGFGGDETLDQAEALRYAFRLRLQGRSISGVTVSKVATISAPTLRPFDSRAVTFVSASYQFTLHAPL